MDKDKVKDATRLPLQSAVRRCSWAERSPEESIYHDTEWGVPTHEDSTIFEFLVLETMQAGLSWTMIMKRREGMRKAFDGFDYHKIAAYDDEKEAALLQNPDVIRHRLKIASLKKNACAFMKVQEEFGSFATYIWGFTDGNTIVGHWQKEGDAPTTTALSDIISKDLKKRGFTFVGSTIVYSFLQAIGVVNDHIVSCPRYRMLVNPENE